MAEAVSFQDDSEFLIWAEAHPDDYVINIRREFDPNYVVLHRASCGTLIGAHHAPGALTTRGYRKVGATDRNALLRWIATKKGSDRFSKECRLCQPQ
jgi:hypothetical protein